MKCGYNIVRTKIVGLDAALPFFATNSPSQKLDATDADFVEVIHTNAGNFGKIETLGHFDYYINGGLSQPACNEHKSEYSTLYPYEKRKVLHKRLNRGNVNHAIFWSETF